MPKYVCSGAPTSGAFSPSELSAWMLGVTVTNGAKERSGTHWSVYDRK